MVLANPTHVKADEIYIYTGGPTAAHVRADDIILVLFPTGNCEVKAGDVVSYLFQHRNACLGSARTLNMIYT
jgi:hypothetical protein